MAMDTQGDAMRREFLTDVRDGVSHVKGALGVKVTRQEELLFGGYAPLVRRVGQATTALEQARVEVEHLLEMCREADSISMGLVHPPTDFVNGESPITVWLGSVYERVWDVMGALLKLHPEIAAECLAREQATRVGVDSQPAPGPDGSYGTPEPEFEQGTTQGPPVGSVGSGGVVGTGRGATSSP